jgi:hypothetical protein
MSGSLQFNTFRYKVPAVFLEQIGFALDEWIKVGGLDAEWSHKSSVWTRSGEEKWLDWLDIPAQELKRADEKVLIVRRLNFSVNFRPRA